MKNEADQLEQRWIQGLHQTYLRNRRLQKWLVTGVQTAILLLLFVLWEIAGRLKWIDVLLFSYPSKILTQIGKDAVSGELWGHVGVTVGETMAGFCLAHCSVHCWRYLFGGRRFCRGCLTRIWSCLTVCPR